MNQIKSNRIDKLIHIWSEILEWAIDYHIIYIINWNKIPSRTLPLFSLSRTYSYSVTEEILLAICNISQCINKIE